MQLRLATVLSPEEYVGQEVWKEALLEDCPLHPEGGCGFVRNGTYKRKYPEGARIARWYCRLGGVTFSLLPDCLASRFPGSLNEMEAVIIVVEQSTSQEAAADILRPDIELPGALRWIRRRVLLIRAALTVLIGIFYFLPADCRPTISSFRSALCSEHLLLELRAMAGSHLHLLPPPLGFGPHPQSQKRPKDHFQHQTGTDPPAPNR